MSCKNKNLQIFIAVLLSLSMLLTFAACGKSSTETTTKKASNTGTDVSDDDMFTERDLDPSYDTLTGTINLSDKGTKSTTKNATVKDSTITIIDEGVYEITGSLSNGQIIIDAENTDKIQLVFNNASIANSSSAPIYIKQADKVFISLNEGTTNSLIVSGDYVAIDDNKIDGAIFSKDDLTINGKGTLNITAKYGHGIVCKDDMVIANATVNIESADHGIQANDSIRIASGTITINSVEDGLHCDNTDDDGNTVGFVYIKDGIISIATKDDGIHAAESLTIKGGKINISESYEGLEAQTIVISGGDINVNASDDGLNAAGGNDSSGFGGGMGKDAFASDDSCGITISGGKLTVNADGDGIDSNGNLVVSGGEIYVAGPQNDGNGALDYGGTATITGGTIIAAGMSGMAQNFGTDSTQGSMLISTGSTTTGEIVLKDSSGNTLATFTTDKSFNSVVISSKDIKKGSTYIVTIGGTDKTVEMSDLIYTESGMGTMGGGHGGGNMGGDRMQQSGGKPSGGFPGMQKQ